MAYLEPGAYLGYKNMGSLQGTGAPAQIPLIIGTGADTVIVSEVITRAASGQADALPNAEWKRVISVGYTQKTNDFKSSANYNFNRENGQIVWQHNQGPTQGESYVVVAECEAPESRYELQLVYPDTYREIYGETDFIDEDGAKLNKLVLGLKAVFGAGAPVAYALQVKPAKGKAVTSDDYQKALAKVKTVADVYRIVPMDLSNDINAIVDAHVNNCSSYEERMERVVRYSCAASPDTFAEVLTQVGGYAAGKASRRVCVPYPNKANMMLSDGKLHEVDGAVISAAIAGLQSYLPGYQSATRSTISVFDSLVGVEMTRVEKNKLAEKGVLILEQPSGAGTPISIRHQLTTDMSSVATKEASITSIRDHVAQRYRNVAEAYIGKYNITPDTITRITGSLKSTTQDMVQEGWILETSQITSVAQDINNPDTLIIEAKVDVPYPCNYIKITVVAD